MLHFIYRQNFNQTGLLADDSNRSDGFFESKIDSEHRQDEFFKQIFLFSLMNYMDEDRINRARSENTKRTR